ncbi:MAG: serine/threonine-protein phosphatase [Treponema sp.]|nr:serine/threonine-protein phosphatase [Treponema sp.]
MIITLSVSAVCDVGCKKPNNEDMILLNDLMFRDGKKNVVFKNTEKLVIAVADGVGGLNKGEVASEKVLEALRSFLSNIPGDLSNDELQGVLETFTEETHAGLSKDMGSTLAGLFFYRDKLFRFHAGDSRIYRMRRGELERLTIDHSLRESGGQTDAPSNIITNAIGGGSSAFIEFAEIEYPFFKNDIYMLSSDGMHDMLEFDEIYSIMVKPNAAEKLNDMSKKKGGKDNISIVIININIK